VSYGQDHGQEPGQLYRFPYGQASGQERGQDSGQEPSPRAWVEPTAETMAIEFPRWHVWQGIAGLWYARKMLASPPVVLRGEDLMDLRDQIRGWIGNH
jgi:hypothetical protein